MDHKGLVFVVDDDPSMRDLVQMALHRAGLVAKTFGSIEELVATGVCLSNDAPPVSEGGCCILLDLEMPGMSGLEFLQKLHQHPSGEACSVIVVTGRGSVTTAVQSMKLGVADFLEKPFEIDALVALVQKTLTRHREHTARAAENLAIRQRIAKLSPRERELLDAIVEGRSTKMIADSLGISARTVDHHRANLMQKMKADNVADLVRMSVKADYRTI